MECQEAMALVLSARVLAPDEASGEGSAGEWAEWEGADLQQALSESASARSVARSYPIKGESRATR